MSKKTPDILRYPTDEEHLAVVNRKLNDLAGMIDFLAMQEMDEVNAIVIYKYLLLHELTCLSANLDVSGRNLITLYSFQQLLDEFTTELPYGNFLRLAIESLQYLLDPKSWREYVAGGEKLITGETHYVDGS